MPVTDPFTAHTDRYERWFDTYDHAYRSELDALGRFVPESGDGLEVGVGTGRFAAPLGIQTGLDPTPAMLQRAVERGVAGVRGVAEALPFRDGSFDTVLVVTTICFVDDVNRTLREARRVLRPDGRLVVGYVDRESPLGERYEAHKAENPFYRAATFVSTDELVERLEAAGFDDVAFVQTVFEMPEDMNGPDEVRAGSGEESFVVVSARVR